MNQERFNELLEKENYDTICKELDGLMDSPLYNGMFAARTLLIFFSMLKTLISLRDTQDLKVNYDVFFKYFEIKNMKELIKNKHIAQHSRDHIVSYISSLTDGTYHDDRYIYYNSNFHDDATSQLKCQIVL